MRNAIISVLSFVILPSIAAAHGVGTSFEKIVDSKLVDIGYDIPFDTAESTLMDFAVFDMKGETVSGLADFSSVRVRFYSGSSVQLDRTLEKPDFGKVYTEFLPEKTGNWVLKSEFFLDSQPLVSAEFPVLITSTPVEFTVPAGVIFGLIGSCLIGAMWFYLEILIVAVPNQHSLPRPSTILLLAAAFSLVSLTVYGRSLNNQFVSWDDFGLIVENRNVTQLNAESVKNVFTSYDPELYIPLTFVSYQVNHAIAGVSPTIYHATDLALHTSNALLVALVAWLLLGTNAVPVFLGLLFLLHPLNTEAVAWASARKDVLSTFFFLTSLICYILWRAENKGKWYAWSIALFAFGLLSKVMVVTLPVVFLLMDRLEGRRLSLELLKEKVPHFALALLFGIVALFGKSSALEASTLLQKVLMAAKSTVFYIEKFFMPTGLSFAYPYNGSISLAQSVFLIPLILCLALSACLILLRKRQPLILFGTAFFLLTLVPTFTNFYKGGDIYFASDRYAYIPMIGLLIACGSALQIAYERWRKAEWTLSAVLVSVLCVCAYLSSAQANVWKDSLSLYAHAIEHYPDSRAAHHNLGMEYLRAGLAKEAIAEFALAQAVKDDPRTRVSRAAALVTLGKYDEARAEYLTVMGMDDDEPDAYYGLGNIEYKLGNFEAAIPYYRKALEKRADYTNALNNLGGIYLSLGRWKEAIETLNQTIAIRPEFPEAYYNLGGAYEADGQAGLAKAAYTKAIELNPANADALASLASLLYEEGDIDAAARLLRQALESDDSNATAHRLLQRMRSDGRAT